MFYNILILNYNYYLYSTRVSADVTVGAGESLNQWGGAVVPLHRQITFESHPVLVAGARAKVNIRQ